MRDNVYLPLLLARATPDRCIHDIEPETDRMNSSQTSSAPKTATELRRAFLKHFEERGHVVVPSSPLVPHGDPTLLFTTAGMVQFKPHYLATGDVPYTRAVSVQKCLRLTDVDRVGMTPRHDTFFEMLGNFSFGPREKGAYFKEEAIQFAWEFVTGVLGIPKQRLYASIFGGEGNLPRDDEAETLWKRIGLAPDHIVALGREDNFWGPAGGQGACGPCSEIYFDLGEKRPAYLPEGAFWGERPGDPGDRYMEFWNLVFPQYDAQADGSLRRLARPGIDTGMGIERLALVVQGKSTIFETDVFAPLVEMVLGLSSPAAAKREISTRDARIVADHVRALVFAIAEGALPGNEGAGYVLRRLLRRAVTRGRSREGLAIPQAFLAEVGGRAITMFAPSYPELERHRDQVLRVLDQEEAGFVQTFEAGLARLEEMLLAGRGALSGEEVFGLHDTYGFPVELTEEIAAERGARVDREGYERAMEEQRRRARAASKFVKGDERARIPWTVVSEGADSEFLGYATLEADGLRLTRWRALESGEIELALDRTPAYAESGGQVADRGRLEAGGAIADLAHVYKEADTIVHRVRLTSGERDAFIGAASAGRLAARVDAAHRFPTMRHHTATHLLHAVLRQTLGTHVRQAGSLVAPDRLRFDYTHFEAPTEEQLDAIERTVNEWILRNVEVTWRVMPIDEAKKLGAMALFGEKYGAEVRMVQVPAVEEAGIPGSRELCGGTHVSRTGDIGAFVIVSDAAIASGVRRIEALCGHAAIAHMKAQGELLSRAAAALQSNPASLPEQIEKLKAENERLEKSAKELQRGGLETEMERLVASAASGSNGRWVVGTIEAEAGVDAVREAADRLRNRLGRGAAVLAISSEGKLMFLAAVTDDLVSEKRLKADELVRAVAKVAGGSGGGKPHLALAGGKDPSKRDEALAEARRLLEAALA
jgi:alanyl-tRNA synthetase